MLLLYFNLNQITGTIKYVLLATNLLSNYKTHSFDEVVPVIIDYISIASLLDENPTAFEKLVTSLVEPKK